PFIARVDRGGAVQAQAVGGVHIVQVNALDGRGQEAVGRGNDEPAADHVPAQGDQGAGAIAADIDDAGEQVAEHGRARVHGKGITGRAHRQGRVEGDDRYNAVFELLDTQAKGPAGGPAARRVPVRAHPEVHRGS